MGTATPLVAAMWAGAGAGFVGGTMGTALNGGTVGQSLMAGFTGALMGAATGYAGAYMSAAIGAVGIIPGALSGAATSTTLGAMTNIISGNDWNAGLGMTAVFGAVGGGYSGFSAAKASGAGIWFGTAAKPSASVIAGNIDTQTKQAQASYEKSTQVQSEPTTTVNGKPIDWTGYPEGEIRPNGALKTLEGDAYDAARKSANTANAALRRSNPEFFKGLEIHEIQPVKFNGSPTDFSNKLFLTRPEHIKFTNYWNQVLRNK